MRNTQINIPEQLAAVIVKVCIVHLEQIDNKVLSYRLTMFTHTRIMVVSHSQTTTFFCVGMGKVESCTLALRCLCNVPLQSG